ncbi:MAG: aminotransferase class V-fold PLP-dependent enzyme [Lachnospiraceae bacterium]|nr:aminotransferase class V-fold PLP-dependent enzyme [Lachnospiraceae bacterium]
MMQTLYDSLVNYGVSDFYPYHMPGHKRSHSAGALSEIYKLDITEIDGFDNLHQAEGIIKQSQERAAKLYGSEETYFLVNGSTCGVLAAVSAVTDRQDTVLIARNCHKSVYHAAFLKELNLRYIYPSKMTEYDISDAVSLEEVKTALERYPECRAVVITSPTYEGIVSDIEAISRVVHEKGKILIVDEAHGAHFGLAKGIPENAVRQGADLVIHSLHKTLPSMTQTALLHVNGPRIDRVKLRRYLSIYQSSSPSYVLMASMDSCISFLLENAESSFEKLKNFHRKFLSCMEECRHIRIGKEEVLQKKGYNFSAWDICKIVISVKGTSMNGQELYDKLLDEFHLQMEMAADSYVLAIMTISDGEEGWKRLADALLQIDGRIEDRIKDRIKDMTRDVNVITDEASQTGISYQPTVKMTIAQALEHNSKEVPLELAEGEISGGFINLYPPGIPIIVPGEVIDACIVSHIRESLKLGLRVQGISENAEVVII